MAGKPFRGVNEFLRERFGEKVGKLCLDGGFTCPNRDGTLGHEGCIFCDERGSGEFAGERVASLPAQVAAQKSLMATKWHINKFIAYFQNFTNTYASVDDLREKYLSALDCESVVGLALATRPDALPPPVLDLLGDMAAQTFLWVELGFQTLHDSKAAWLGRGYNRQDFDASVKALRERGIPVVAHLILGLPGESREEMWESARHCVEQGVWGFKFHMLHVVRGTRLAQEFARAPFPLLEQREYISLVADILERLPSDSVIHRITGDGSRKSLVAPLWTLEKKRVYTGVESELHRRGTEQGIFFARQ